MGQALLSGIWALHKVWHILNEGSGSGMDRRGHMTGLHDFLNVGGERNKSQKETLRFMVWMCRLLVVFLIKQEKKRIGVVRRK